MPNVNITIDQLNTLRTNLKAARDKLVDALFEFEDATNAFRETKRRFKPGSTQYNDAAKRVDDATTALDDPDPTKGARAAEAAAYVSLQSGLSSWLIDVAAENYVTPDFDVGRLIASFPIVMFPIRIETRFELRPSPALPTLKVRVFPDEIFMNRHEAALTVEEQQAGKKYFDDLNEQGNEEDRWREIIGRFTPERAAHILRVMQPTGFNTIPSPGFCTDRLKGGDNVTLTYPTNVKQRAGSWTRPAEAILPDRWVVVTYRNGARRVIYGAPIVEPLAITTDPGLPQAQQTQISSDPKYKIDERIRWTVDFDRAKAVGMGIEITLDMNEAAIGTGGFDRVLVFGVKTSMNAATTSDMLTDLFDAHHYTRGLAFVRQGTPTNNTKDSPTPFPPDDKDGERSYEIERLHPPAPLGATDNCLSGDTDGAQFASALGLPNRLFANVDRATEKEMSRSIAMNVAVWPLTFGYFMKVLMDPLFSDDAIKTARSYVAAFVRPRGIAPAFRVGEVPYGVLPVTSIYNWTQGSNIPGNPEALTAKIIEPLKRLFQIWLDASARVPRVTGNAADPDVELMSILSTYPSTKEIRVRHGVGHVVWYNIFNLFGWSFTRVEQQLNVFTETLFRRIGHPEWRPRIGSIFFDSRAWRLLFPLVDPKPSEDDTLAGDGNPNFINGLHDATFQQLKDDTVSPKPTGFSLLYSILRHATLLEYSRIADGLATAALKWKEPELFGFPSQTSPPPTIVAEALALLASAIAAELQPQLDALKALADAKLAELDRLLGETLDIASHRLDAWITAVATQRLFFLRIVSEGAAGQYLGGYAWVENLRPIRRQTQTVDNITYEVQQGTGGYIHTPSMTHAATAAILRSAHISARREDPSRYAVDLSSRRVRNARRVLDEVRAGQPLGAVLGYHFERGLHEGHPGVPDLDKVRFAFRSVFPLVAGKNGVDTSEPAENIAARNVVDGLALLRADREGTIDYANGPGLPRPQTNQFLAVKDEIRKLTELCDSVADLLTAESVYQLARGNITAAGPPLENLVVGGPPPDPAVARSARTGIGLAHRVALVFPDRTRTLPGHWPAPTPRALAEPTLDAWLSGTIGDASQVTCRVTFTEAPGSITVALSDLGLRPLDVLALAQVALQQGLDSVLDGRVLTAALAGDTSKTNVEIDYDPQPGRNPKGDRTFPEVFEVARALGAALGGGRPLEIGDLVSPSEVDEVSADPDVETTARADVADIEARASAASDALSEITNSTTVSAGKSLALATQLVDPANPTAAEIQNLRAALTIAAYFAPGSAFPPRTAAGTDLLEIARAARKELQRRIDAVAKLQPTPPPTLAKDRSELAIATIKAIFGNDFVALPALHVPRSEEIDRAFDSRDDLVNGDPTALPRYLQQATRTRANLRRFQKFSLYSRALGVAPLSLNVAQLPRVPGERWLGVELAGELKEGRAAILLLSDEETPDTGSPWRGVLLEQWTEVIPKTKEQTAIAFHYDTPRAAAPQAVLVAVPASLGETWQFEDVVAMLNETLDLAKVRAVDAELLPLGQTLPLAVMAQNDSPDITFATAFSAFVGAPSQEAFQGFT